MIIQEHFIHFAETALLIISILMLGGLFLLGLVRAAAAIRARLVK